MVKIKNSFKTLKHFIFLTGLIIGSAHFSFGGVKVAIYQGSFDPLTQGHEAIILFLLQNYDDVYVVPDRSTAYKKLNPFNLRNQMIQSVTQKLQNLSGNHHRIRLFNEQDLKRYQEHTHEMDPTRSGTDMWDVNLQVMNQYEGRRDVEFYNVVGADTLKWIATDPEPRKYLPQGKMKEMKLLVLDRPFVSGGQKLNGYYSKNGLQGVRDFLIQKSSESGQNLIEPQGEFDRINGQQVMVSSISGIEEISSTKVRNCLKALKAIGPFNRIPDPTDLTELKATLKAPDKKAIIRALEGLISNEIIRLISESNLEYQDLYLDKGNPDECTPEYRSGARDKNLIQKARI